jgi:hypothetical protein
LCPSQSLVAGQDITDVAIDSSMAYFTVGQQGTTVPTSPNGLVQAVPLGGGAVVTLATAQDFPSSIAAGASDVYWTDKTEQGGFIGSVMMIAKTGGTPVALASSLDYADSVAVGNVTVTVGGTTTTFEEVAFTSEHTDFHNYIQTIAPSSGVSQMGMGFGGIVFAGSNLYWSGAGGIMSAPALAGVGSPTTIVANQSGGAGIAIDSANVYWADYNDSAIILESGSTLPTSPGYVMQAPLAGGTPITLYTVPANFDGPKGIAVDASFVYFSYWDVGHSIAYLAKVPIGGGTAITLAAIPNAATYGRLSLDASSVYWVAGGGVWKTTK